MRTSAARVAQWLGFVSDLLSGEPLCELPHDLVFDQLAMTFAWAGCPTTGAGPADHQA